MSDASETLHPAKQGGEAGAQGNPEIWDALREDVGGLADAALQQGRQFVDTARDQATTFADERKDLAAKAVSDIATSLRDSGKALEEQPNLHGFVSTAADGLDQLAETIRNRSFGEIYTDLEEVIRRRPVLTATATLIAGFLAARFIKSSGEQLAAAEMRRRIDAGARNRQHAGHRSSGQASS